MTALIECRELSKAFGGKRALDGLNLTISSGKPIGLVGPNGAGKTTFFSLISGFLNPTSGEIRILGHRPDMSVLKGQIGILPQDTPFMPGIPVASQFILFARLHGLNKKDSKEETTRVLKLLSVLNLAKQYPETLSHGQRKRVAIAQALIGKPELVLLDEPTAGLDPVAANDVRMLIQRLAGEITFMVSSHNLDEIEDICGEIILIDKGKLVTHRTITELVEHDSCLTFLLEKTLTDDIKAELSNHPDIHKVEQDPANPQRISVYFDNPNPNQLQIRILEIFQNYNAGIIEFSRGAALTDKVVNLVKEG